MSPLVRRVADAEAVARTAAEEIVNAAARAVAARGRFTLALSGGSSPRRLYQLLADARQPYRQRIRWDAVHLFFGDERHVPPGDPDSNYRMAREALLEQVPSASVHRIRAELEDAEAAAAAYEADLALSFGLDAARDPPPRIDLVLLGLGPDGHTASLFPGSSALEERRRWVVAPWVERLRAHRITLTLPVLDRARAVLFEVSGAEKAEALARVLAPAPGAESPPAARVRLEDGPVVWIADAAAASRLGPPERAT
jgi:6-phosphogluconolactonase